MSGTLKYSCEDDGASVTHVDVNRQLLGSGVKLP